MEKEEMAEERGKANRQTGRIEELMNRQFEKEGGREESSQPLQTADGRLIKSNGITNR